MLIILLVLLGVSFLFLMEGTKSIDKQDKSAHVEIVKVKRCPPHKWSYVEVKDTEGSTVRWKIVCDICGPMQSHDKPTGGDY